MKRILVFMFSKSNTEQHGWNDFWRDFDKFEDALMALRKEAGENSWQIIDTKLEKNPYFTSDDVDSNFNLIHGGYGQPPIGAGYVVRGGPSIAEEMECRERIKAFERGEDMSKWVYKKPTFLV
ncbi:MAG: hypothetical protein EPN46_03900 [Candidimonas sp.]|nr:MAG: hypothetical protein EPN77_09445 [Candidimonas sp.]TAM26799.1 MAG: hypothetical protein EPN62_01005 [Candidimonas sp.]TAM79270.1 MAG: hypothetical protein EPN46_03900 [Candidimonas sp.]